MEDRERKWLWIKRVLVGVGLALMAFLITLQSPDSIFSKNSMPGTDSGVFQYIGEMMTKGYVPYRDLFDHKGMLIHFINFLGALIPGGSGIWFLEILCMFLAVFGCYKIARLFCNRGYAVFAVLIVFALMHLYYDGGNYTEEYALPFQMAALYIFLDYFLNQKVTDLRLLVCGLSFSCVFFLRANMISIWAVFCIMVLIRCVCRKEYRSLMRFLAWFLLGVAIVALPILIYLLCNHALGDFIYDYIIFNGLYATNPGYATTADKLSMTVYFSNTVPVIFALLIILAAILSRENSWFHAGYLVYMAATVILIGMSGKQYNHYGMTILPMLVYPYSALFGKFQTVKVRKSWPHLILGIYLLFGVVLAQWHTMADNAKYRINADEWDTDLDRVVTYIQKHTSEEDAISVYGNRNLIYSLSDRRSASKYTYQTPIAQIDNTIKEQYYADLEEVKPKVVVLATGTDDSTMKDFLTTRGYERVAEYGSYRIYGY